MGWQARLKQFGVRLALCLLLLGGAYLLVVAQPWASQNKPLTDAQKLAKLRATLGESYLTGAALGSFADSTTLASNNLSRLQGQLAQATQALEAATKAAPRQLPQPTRQQIETVIATQQQAHKAYLATYDIFDKVMLYDPEADLKPLDVNRQKSELSQRAEAAQSGLKKAADNTTTVADNRNLSVQDNNLGSLVTAPTKQALLDQADCLGRLAVAPGEQMASLRGQCIEAYPSLRLQAIQNIIEKSYNADYQAAMKARIPPLLATLDKLVDDN